MIHLFYIFLICISVGTVYLTLDNSDEPTNENKQITKKPEKIIQLSKDPKIQYIETIPSFIKNDLEALNVSSQDLSKEQWEEFLRKKSSKLFQRFSNKYLNDSSLLHYLLTQNNSINMENIQELIIEFGFDINKKNKTGESPLVYGLKNNITLTTDDVLEFISIGALLDETAFMAILKNEAAINREEIISLFLQEGFSYKNLKFLSILTLPSNRKYLWDYLKSSNINEKINEKYSLLEYIAMKKIDNKIIDFFLQTNPDLKKENDGYNVLHSAITNFRISDSNIQRMIDLGADINGQSPNSLNTPLMTLIIHRSIPPKIKLSRVELLLNNGADVTIKNTQGKTIYEYLKRNSIENRIIELIETH